MAALGVPTTRSLAAVATGEAVARERVLPGAVLTRVASSHIRVGTFQYFYARRDEEALKGLLDHVVARHYPDIEPTALALLEAVMTRQADLIARWMGVGFVHGVMNTDNVTVSGETIDYGPCAFLDAYRPETVFSAIDAGGRYAFANQPLVAHWNLAQLAQALLPLVSGEPDAAVAVAQDAVDRFPDLYRAAWLRVMRAKLGLAEAREGDAALAEDLLARMAAEGADFTLAFRRLADLVPGGEGAGAGTGPRDLFADGSVFDDWAARWRARQAEERAEPSARRAAMRAVNPLFVARNHRVEAALDAAEEGDLDPLDTLLSVLARPFDDQPGREAYAAPPRMGEAVVRTFCGT
ncbi:MAG: YdiU family protein, partial [Paracoccaceae bacterium]